MTTEAEGRLEKAQLCLLGQRVVKNAAHDPYFRNVWKLLKNKLHAR
jgi:hypothetical protein